MKTDRSVDQERVARSESRIEEKKTISSRGEARSKLSKAGTKNENELAEIQEEEKKVPLKSRAGSPVSCHSEKEKEKQTPIDE